jgi:hypothetical protein
MLSVAGVMLKISNANATGVAVTLIYSAPVSLVRVVAPLPECPRQVAPDVNVNALDDQV